MPLTKTKSSSKPGSSFELNRERRIRQRTNGIHGLVSERTTSTQLAHGALVHGVGRDLAALREEDAGGLSGGAVGDGVEVAYVDSDWDG